MSASFNSQKKKALAQIKGAKRILIVPSSPVDSDAVGSALALQIILQGMGKKADLKYSFPGISRFHYLPHFSKIKIEDTFAIDFSKFDLTIFLDAQRLDLFYDQKKHLEMLQIPKSTKTILIDHHPEVAKFTTLSVRDQKASSTAEVVYRLLENQKISKDAATCLLAGMSEDTTQFRHSSSHLTLDIASKLLKVGGDMDLVVQNIFKTAKFKTIKFTGKLISRIKIDSKYKYSYLAIAKKLWQKENVLAHEFRSAIFSVVDDEMVGIDGIDFAFVVSEKEPGVFTGSFRRRNNQSVNVAKFAEKLNGGGHEGGAGFRIEAKSVPEALKIVRQTIKQNYNRARIENRKN